MGEQIKFCKYCEKWKPLSEYYRNTQRPGGLMYKCKDCAKEYNRRWREKNHERMMRRQREYYLENLDKIRAYDKERYWANRDEVLARCARYRATHVDERKAYNKKRYWANKDELNAKTKAYRDANKEHVRALARATYHRNKAHRSKQVRERYHADPVFKLKMQARGMLRRSFRRKGRRKDNHSPAILGCSLDFFVEYLKQTWLDEYGTEWNGQPCHIDHIIPLITVNTEEEIKKLCHYTNLRLVTPEDNYKKIQSDKELVKRKEESERDRD